MSVPKVESNIDWISKVLDLILLGIRILVINNIKYALVDNNNNVLEGPWSYPVLKKYLMRISWKKKIPITINKTNGMQRVFSSEIDDAIQQRAIDVSTEMFRLYKKPGKEKELDLRDPEVLLDTFRSTANSMRSFVELKDGKVYFQLKTFYVAWLRDLELRGFQGRPLGKMNFYQELVKVGISKKPRNFMLNRMHAFRLEIIHPELQSLLRQKRPEGMI